MSNKKHLHQLFDLYGNNKTANDGMRALPSCPKVDSKYPKAPNEHTKPTIPLTKVSILIF